MSFTNAQLAQKIAKLVEYWQGFNQEYSDWLGGSASGGPNSDGSYPLTNWQGLTYLVKSPARLQEDVDNIVAGAQGFSQQAADSATTATEQAGIATTQAGLSEAARIAAETARTAAQQAESSAIDAKVTAVAQANVATANAQQTAADVVTVTDARDETLQARNEAVQAALDAAQFNPALFGALAEAETVTGVWDFSNGLQVGGAAITAALVAQWDAAYSWGNHADAGYASASDLSGYLPLSGGALSGDLTVKKILFEGGDHQINNNDGKGNFNIRIGHGPAETYSKSGQGAVHMEFHHDSGSEGNPGLTIHISEDASAKNAGDPIVWAKALSMRADGTFTWAGNAIYHAGNFTDNSANWDTAYSWGNHADAGYLTSYTETDPTVAAHIKAITAGQINNWDAAYSWGNHAEAGYAPASHTHSYLPLSGGTITGPLSLDGVVTLPANRYNGYDGTYAMDCQNSDIVGLNALYFNDASNSVNEGIAFPRDSGTGINAYSYLRAYQDKLRFSPDGSADYEVYHTGHANFSVTAFDLKFGMEDQTTRGDSGASRAMVKQNGLLEINYARDFGMTKINSLNYMQVDTQNGYVRIGPNNTSYCHFYTDRAKFYFDKEVRVDGDIRCGPSYNQFVLRHASSSYSSGNITFSTSAPSGGSNGDIWFQY